MAVYFRFLFMTVFMIVLSTVIPFIWWLIFRKKEETFFTWLGIKKIKKENILSTFLWIVIGIFVLLFISVFLILTNNIFYGLLTKGWVDIAAEIREVIREVFFAPWVKGPYSSVTLSMLPPALFLTITFFSLPKEIFFRGFLLKRIQNKFGFIIANIIQAILEGGFYFLANMNSLYANGKISLNWILLVCRIAVYLGIRAAFIGYINEKKAGGSVLPGWIMNALYYMSNALDITKIYMIM